MQRALFVFLRVLSISQTPIYVINQYLNRSNMLESRSCGLPHPMEVGESFGRGTWEILASRRSELQLHGAHTLLYSQHITPLPPSIHLNHRLLASKDPYSSNLLTTKAQPVSTTSTHRAVQRNNLTSIERTTKTSPPWRHTRTSRSRPPSSPTSKPPCPPPRPSGPTAARRPNSAL